MFIVRLYKKKKSCDVKISCVLKGDSAESADLSPALIALMLSNILLGMVTLLLVWTLCKKQKKDPTGTSEYGSYDDKVVLYCVVIHTDGTPLCFQQHQDPAMNLLKAAK